MKNIRKFKSFDSINEEVPFDMNVYKEIKGSRWTEEEKLDLADLGVDKIERNKAFFNEANYTILVTKGNENSGNGLNWYTAKVEGGNEGYFSDLGWSNFLSKLGPWIMSGTPKPRY